MSLWAQGRFIGLCVIGVIGVAVSAHAASNRPFWTEQAMFRFGDDLFFTGQATCAPSAEEGRQRAYNAALQEMLNYARMKELTGISIETQMVYEEETSSCRAGQKSVWRLLRAPAERLDKLNRMAAQQGASQELRGGGNGRVKKVRDMTPQVGMFKDDAYELFGQPKSVSIVRSGAELNWEYPKFGLTLVFDNNGYLLRWKHAGPGGNGQESGPSAPLKSEFGGLEGSIDPSKSKKAQDEAVDLSKRLGEMQVESDARRQQTSMARYCERIYPDDRKLQDLCLHYEAEKRRQSPVSSDAIESYADRVSEISCTRRWPRDIALRDSCQRLERERILNLHRGR